MTAALAITKRELRSYFNSPVAYIVVTAFMLISGFFFWKSVFIERQAEMRGFFGITPILFALIMPAITMRLISEEKGSGTLELLITMPLKDWEVVLGKYLAALGLLATLLALTLVYAVSLSFVGPLDVSAALTGYLGLLLMGGAYLAIGVMASAFTRNQIVAFILAFAICFALYLFGTIVQIVPKEIQPIVSFLAIGNHFDSLGRGVIDSRDVLYYLSVITISLVIATVSLESRKWK